MAVPAVAGAQDCPEASPTYADACGPTFAVPTWTDAGGWTDPSQYSTIQLADVNGDGRDEPLARSDAGLEIWWFDTSVGQWRPQVDANATPQILTDFRSPRPGETPATDWTKPEYYSTIQAADIDAPTGFPPTSSQPGAEILARFADGMRVYRYSPPAGSHALPASVALHAPRLYLESRLVLSDGRLRHRLRLEHHVRCARDARGNIDRLVFVRNRSYPARPGLAVSLHGPRRVRPGTTVRYVARLRNARRGRNRPASSLWDVTLTTGARTTRIRELRRGHARALSLRRRVPTAARTPFCVDVVATAAGARAARARLCSAVDAARAPAFTG